MIRQYRWTEEELHRELHRLDDLIARVSRSDDERSRYVAAYLRQVRSDRRDALAVLKNREATAPDPHRPCSPTRSPLHWPTPRSLAGGGMLN